MVYMNFEKLLPEFCTIENGVDENEDRRQYAPS
jgi:hypothetical protein